MSSYFTLSPKTGKFPVGEMERYLSQLPFVIRSPRDPRVYLFHWSEQEAENLRSALTADPEFPMPNVGIVFVSENVVSITQETTTRVRGYLRDFVEWILHEVDCRAEDEEHNEIEASSAVALLSELFD